MMRWLAAGVFAIAAATVSADELPAACGSDPSLRLPLERLEREQREEVQQALQLIDGSARRVLALRSYIRSGDVIAARWSWTQQQIDTYRASDEYRDLLAEIDKIRVQFEQANPGTTLYANTDVRSLDQQLQRWNENKSVGAIAAELQQTLCAEAAANPSLTKPANALRDFLVRWQPSSPAPLAAPGLSLHGRARAIDFQIEQGKRIIAGPDTSRIADDWVASGWAGKLRTAIEKASPRFHGPLTMPNEPWHFEYRP
ncbi:MAG TPA: hypothetical protein VIT67_10735 [Povalibacter sp.]